MVFGPELVLLGPDEQFTVLSLSGGRPKRPHTRRSLCLLLGPDFCTDIITIETADHARLQLQLAYNWWVKGNWMDWQLAQVLIRMRGWIPCVVFWSFKDYRITWLDGTMEVFSKSLPKAGVLILSRTNCFPLFSRKSPAMGYLQLWEAGKIVLTVRKFHGVFRPLDGLVFL